MTGLQRYTISITGEDGEIHEYGCQGNTIYAAAKTAIIMAKENGVKPRWMNGVVAVSEREAVNAQP